MYLKDFAEAMSRFHVHDTPAEAVLDAMVMFAYCDGRATVAEVQYIADLRFGGDLERAIPDIQQATERLRSDGDFVGAMRRISSLVASNAHREEVFAYATAVLYADLSRSEAEGKALDSLCEILRLPSERGIEIVNEVVRNVETHDPIVQLPADRPLPASYEKGVDWPGFRLPGAVGDVPAAPPKAPASSAPKATPTIKATPKAKAKAAKAKPAAKPAAKAKTAGKSKSAAKAKPAASKSKTKAAASKSGARRPSKSR